MTDRDALLNAIFDAPADDAPRLVYADWLDEHGEPERAEFVRVQIKIADLNRELHSDEDCGDERCPGCQERRVLSARERELTILNTIFWGADLPVPASPDNGVCTWRRGFIESVTLSAADWLTHADTILAAHPVTVVTLTDEPNLAIRTGGAISIIDPPGGSGMTYREAETDWIRRRWPRVKTWHQPPEPAPLTARRLTSHILVPNELFAGPDIRIGMGGTLTADAEFLVNPEYVEQLQAMAAADERERRQAAWGVRSPRPNRKARRAASFGFRPQ